MKKTLFTSFLLTISIISLTQERTFSESKKGYKYGVQEQVSETEMNNILKAKYEKKPPKTVISYSKKEIMKLIFIRIVIF